MPVTFRRFTSSPMRMGVLVSPEARSSAPKMMRTLRNSSVEYSRRKYREASGRIAGSACIQTGMRPESGSTTAVKSRPRNTAMNTACAEAREAFS